MDFTNASAIVTGGAGGFGSATVRTLAQKGDYVPTDCMDEDARSLPALPTQRRGGHQAAVTGVIVAASPGLLPARPSRARRRLPCNARTAGLPALAFPPSASTSTLAPVTLAGDDIRARWAGVGGRS